MKTLKRFIGRAVYFYICPWLVRILQLLPMHKNKIVSMGSEMQTSAQFDAVKMHLQSYSFFIIYRYDDYLGFKWLMKLPKMLYHTATAGTILLEVGTPLLRYFKHNEKQVIIQMWHCLGAFKKVALSVPNASKGYGFRNDKDLARSYHFDYLLDQGKYFNQNYLDSFAPGCKILDDIFCPRIDNLLDSKKQKCIANELVKKYAKLKGKKVLLYTPTFRGLKAQKEGNYFFNIDKVLELLGENYFIILKLHPAMRDAYYNLPGCPRFLDLSYEDVNALMGVADILINDYSSTFLEFVLLGKPCVFYANDIDTYLDERGFYYKYQDFVPGPITYNEEQLASAIINADDRNLSKGFVQQYFGTIPPENSKRLASFIKDYHN